jgi:hypothetical protein
VRSNDEMNVVAEPEIRDYTMYIDPSLPLINNTPMCPSFLNKSIRV